MREARLVGLSQDGTQLILAMAETGEEFAVPVDDRMRAALRGDRARLGQLEIQMESALRPRDIQARIRAGESPEAVAAVAQMPMERVMAFAGPVLAERDHIATLAQRASVRRRGGGDAPARNLGAWVTDRLRLRHVDPTSAEWDAWRREDGRWAVRVSYFVESEDEAEKKDEKIGMFAYDAPGRYVVPDDDEARWLVGEQPQVLPTPVQPQPGERRLAAVADIDPILAPDHGADSYEAGFEDTVALRRRNHPVSREDAYSRDDSARYSRDDSRYSRDDAARSRNEPAGYSRDEAAGSRGDRFSRDESAGSRGDRYPGNEPAGYPRDDSAGHQREVSRTSRDTDRGPRRVHSVPNPDEEPTLIDVPVDQPPAPRPSVRAVERPTTPPTYASPANPREDQTDRDSAAEAAPRPQPAPAARATPSRTADAPNRPAGPRPTPPRPTDEHPVEARSPQPQPQEQTAQPTQQPATKQPHTEQSATPEQPALPDGTDEATDTPAKKKPARRGKRASVPSWDEIMFGKKAD
ncbi:septation protein SepH [Kribbella sp. WER1]